MSAIVRIAIHGGQGRCRRGERRRGEGRGAESIALGCPRRELDGGFQKALRFGALRSLLINSIEALRSFFAPPLTLPVFARGSYTAPLPWDTCNNSCGLSSAPDILTESSPWQLAQQKGGWIGDFIDRSDTLKEHRES